MIVPFHPGRGLIIIPVILEGPAGRYTIRLILDTGATRTLISLPMLQAVGYDPSLTPPRQFTSASGVSNATLVSVLRLTALGHTSVNFPILAHSLPARMMADGLLGLDFLRGKVLTVDFAAGQLALM